MQCFSARLNVRNLDRFRRVIASAITVCVLCAATSAAEQKLVKISSQKKDGRTEFFIENLQDAEVTVTLELELKNLASSQPLPFTTTLSPRVKVSAFALTQVEPQEDSTWSYTYFATWGSLTVEHDDSSSYILPYPAGQSFPVSQGFHGKYSHTGGDCYSIDFKMPEGSPVHAAREGKVVGVKDDSSVGGGNKKQSGKQRETIPVKFRTAPLLAEVLSEGRAYRAF
jgi:murein DD-endopeptidase MepM/ murein hydrolase activator NlpD